MILFNRSFLPLSIVFFAVVIFSTPLFGAPVRFDIPQQKASAALALFAKQAKVEVLFSFRDLDGIQAGAVVGEFEMEQALALILGGSGFSARFENGKFVVTRDAHVVSRGIIRGRLVSTRFHDPIPHARVRLVGSAVEAVSGDQGDFQIAGLPAGIYTLGIQSHGYTSLRVDDVNVPTKGALELGTLALRTAQTGPEEMEELVLSASTLTSESYHLLHLEKVVVTPSRFGMDEERSAVSTTLTQQNLLALPQLGEDLYRTISHLPGLAADDYTARFWVRGAPQEQVLSRFDGVDLIEPFHLKDTDGTLSIVDLASIGTLDLYTGGFTAEYGTRLAGVVTLETERYTGRGMRTTLGLSYTGANIANRGAAVDGRLRWLVTGRVGLLGAILNTDKEEKDPEIRPSYFDVGAKLEYDLTPDQTLSFHLLHAADRMTLIPVDNPELHSNYGSDYAWWRWQGNVGSRIRGEAVLAYTQLTTKRDGSGLQEMFFPVTISDKSRLNQWSFRQDWNFGVSDRLLLKGGFEYKSGDAHYDYSSRRQHLLLDGDSFRIAEETADTALGVEGNAVGGYISSRLQPFSALTIEAGLRYDRENYASGADVSPRFTASFTQGATTLRAAWGLYHQAQGLQELSVADAESTFHPSEQAEHRILSLEQRLGRGINLRVEGYQRLTPNPAPHWENVYGRLQTFPEILDDRIRIVPVDAQARGVELVIERRSGSKFLWSGSYAWAKTEETLANGLRIPRRRDQRDTLYLDFNYVPSKKWLFSVAWQYHTGWAVTEQVFTPYFLGNSNLLWISTPGPLYRQRLPDYQRLDFRMQRRFSFRQSEVRVYLDIFNALNQHNISSYGYSPRLENGVVKPNRHDGDKLFPRLPSFGAVWEF